MSVENGPTRLGDMPEFADVVAAAERATQCSPARLAENGVAIQQAISVLPAVGVAAVGAKSVVSVWLSKLLPVVILGSMAGGTAIWLSETRDQPKPNPRIETSANLEAVLPLDAPAIVQAGVEGVPVAEVVSASPPPDLTPRVADKPQKVAPRRAPLPVSEPAESPSEDPPVAPEPRTAGGRSGAISDTAVPIQSHLQAQLRGMKRAAALAKQGHHKQAIAELDALLHNYPNSPLMGDAQGARIESLVASGQIDAGLAAIEHLLAGKMADGKRGPYYRVRGDLLRKKGDCKAAISSYLRAVGLGLRPAEAGAARVGIAKCTKP